ncbi:MAG: DoxX family protein [Candidatus Marinimicrobia bacterium]|nr:DoxX family protein [Candidatus Neomarinimicrobiota bacterium]
MDFLNKISEHGHWLIRLSLAGIFLFHGFIKFPMAEMMSQSMGMPLLMIYLLATMEVVGGIFILAGAIFNDLLTRIAGGIFVLTMTGAIGMVHWPQWSFVASESHPMGGMEFQLLTLLISLLFVAGGNRAVVPASE